MRGGFRRLYRGGVLTGGRRDDAEMHRERSIDQIPKGDRVAAPTTP